MKEKFSVWVVRPGEGDVHWQGLLEAARGIRYGIGMTRHEITGSDECLISADAGRLVIFNAHRANSVATIPADSIIFNAEQVQPEWKIAGHGAAGYLNLLRQHQVWDYSEINVERLRRLGVERVALCPIGHYPALLNISSVEREDVDILFIGSVNERRAKVLESLKQRRVDGGARKLNVKHLFGVYGDERDQWIARSKVVLNMHFYPEPIWEIFRCSHLLANKKCVVSENGGVDPTLETLAAATTEHVSYDKLVDTCVTSVQDAGRRREVGERGFRVFSQISQVEMVQRVVGVGG